MKYRVIEGGYWRHGTLHIESDNTIYENDHIGEQLYRDITGWLIENNDSFSNTYSIGWWPEFFSIFPRKDGIIDVMVAEEGTMWFIPEDNPGFGKVIPNEGVMESWLHGDGNEGNTTDWNETIWVEFFNLFPEGDIRVPESLPGTHMYNWHYRDKSLEV